MLITLNNVLDFGLSVRNYHMVLALPSNKEMYLTLNKPTGYT